jgi:hypothetical protein
VVASFECVTRSRRSVEEMFDLARSIDAHTESQAGSAEEAVGGVTRGLIGAGQDVTWTARHFGIRFSLTSAITEFDPPHRFVDEQTRGPFKAFRHEPEPPHAADAACGPAGRQLLQRCTVRRRRARPATGWR